MRFTGAEMVGVKIGWKGLLSWKELLGLGVGSDAVVPWRQTLRQSI